MTAVILIYLAKNMVIRFIDNYKSHMEAGILNIYFHWLSGLYVFTIITINGASTHSWFISVVDSNELCPVQPVQVNQSKYENHENDGAMVGLDGFLA